MKSAGLALATILCLSLPAADAAAERGDELTVSVLTFGPGDHPFFKFGHNAVWVHDAELGRDSVYNFGTFGFESPWLIVDFLKGRLRYWLSVHGLRSTLAEYRRENREVLAQELELTAAERARLAAMLADNAREENKYYKYDYYRDNCSTRVRDAIDTVIGGKLRAASMAPAEMSWRDHTLRLTADDLWVFVGLHAAMGDFIDQPVDEWDEMFLPAKVTEALRRARVPGPDGERPLVRSERTLVTARRPPLRTGPPQWTAPFALAGLGLGAALVGLAWLSARRAAARIALGAALAGLGLVIGLVGSILVGLWAFTDHEVAFRNENILQLSPLALGLVPLGVRLMRGAAPAPWARWLGVALVAGSVLGLLLKAVPAFDQRNAELIALSLPLWVGVTGALWRLRAQAPRTHEAPAPAGDALRA